MKTALFIVIFLFGCSWVCAVSVESTGRAPQDSQSHKEQALTDALREAVRKGAGVNLLSKTKTENFVLDYDRVFSASFGYIRSYRVLETGYKDGFFSVKIEADVHEGDVDINDELALKQLISLKKSPVLFLDIKQNMTFVPKGMNYAEAWFLERAKKLQLNVVDQVQEFGDAGKAPQPREKHPADFVIRGVLDGSYQVLESDEGNPYSLAGSFEVVAPETNEVIAVLSLPPSSKIKSINQSPKSAAKEVVFKYLDGDAKVAGSGADALFRRIFSRWAADLDLGRSVQIEISKMESKDYYSLVRFLESLDKMGQVKPKVCNPDDISRIGIETRHVHPQLIDLVSNQIRKTHSLSYSTESTMKYEPREWTIWNRIQEFFSANP